MSILKIENKHVVPAIITATILFVIAVITVFIPVAIPGKIGIPVAILTAASLWLCPWHITIALLFSALGDYLGSRGNLLMQMGAFATAHLFYLWFFIQRYILKVEHDKKLTNKAKGYLAMVIFCTMVLLCIAFFKIAPGAGTGIIRIGVYIYATLICIMLISALLQRSSIYAAGAILFVFSDFILAWNMFIEAIPHNSYLILIPYFAAQWLLYIRSTPFRVGLGMRLMRF